MAQATVDVHLKRALGFIEEVESATSDFRERASAHQSTGDEEPFLQGMASILKGNRQLKQRKASLLNDLQLASQEMNQALAVDPEATIEFRGAELTGPHLQAIVPYMHAQVELIWGGAEQAKQLFLNSLRTFELAEAHFMLGLIYEDEYKSAEALKHFERYLEIDPAGEMSVSAVREANAMRNYRRKFRGNWLLLIVLGFFSLGSVFATLLGQFGAGIVGLIFWGGILALYWNKKFK